jgi:hypothetical protein
METFGTNAIREDPRVAEPHPIEALDMARQQNRELRAAIASQVQDLNKENEAMRRTLGTVDLEPSRR